MKQVPSQHEMQSSLHCCDSRGSAQHPVAAGSIRVVSGYWLMLLATMLAGADQLCMRPIVHKCRWHRGMDCDRAPVGGWERAEDTHQTSDVPQNQHRQDADGLATEDCAWYDLGTMQEQMLIAGSLHQSPNVWKHCSMRSRKCPAKPESFDALVGRANAHNCLRAHSVRLRSRCTRG